MRRIRMDDGGMQVVHAGAVWPFSEIEPNSREAVIKLERNEVSPSACFCSSL